MSEYENEKWFDLYQTAMLELDRAAMTGRIGDARTEIATRLEALRQAPILDIEEQRAIQDALRNIRVLEQEEERLAEADRKRILRETTEKLKAVGPKLR